MGTKKLLQVFAAILLALIAGLVTGKESGIFGISFYQIYSLLGALFLNALMLVVVPLVTSSIISGTARMGGEAAFGRLGAKTFGAFLGTTAIAIAIGWFLSVAIEPGSLENAGNVLGRTRPDLVASAEGSAFSKLEQVLLRLVPSNVIAVAAEGQMLGLIFFSLLFGFFISRINHEQRHTLLNFWQGVFQVMMKITELIMKAMPIGVFGLVAKVVASTGIESFTSVGYYFVTVVIGLLLYMLGALSLLLLVIGKVNPLTHLKAMAPALLTAFTTSSSAATLPVTMECIEERVKVSNRIASFTLPLGTSANLAGSSLQVIVSVFFISQIYGVSLSFSTQAIIFLMTWILSIGVAGVPSASLISIVIILNSLGLPSDAIGLLMAVERVLDMTRTMVNTYSNSCCSVLVARSEGENLF